MTSEEYLNLITSEFRKQPNFISTLSISTDFYAYMQDLLLSLIPKFDIDLAVGEQLDIIGIWIGISRNVAVPIPGVFFTWDDTVADGWDYGTWAANTQATEVTVLPDDAYRTLLRAKIAANHWDGTTDGAYAIWDALFPNLLILIQDNQNMTYCMAFIGFIDSLTLALITGGYISLKPEGVLIDCYFTPFDSGPVFAWDSDTPLLQGWDSGSWMYQFAPT